MDKERDRDLISGHFIFFNDACYEIHGMCNICYELRKNERFYKVKFLCVRFLYLL